MSESTPSTSAGPGPRWDPELAPVIPLLPVVSDWTDIERARTELASLLEAATAGITDDPSVTSYDRTIPGPPGAPDIAVRIFRPADAEGRLPAVVHIHGGGFCVGDIDTEHLMGSSAARHASAVVLSVEYRLAPEHPYPAGLDDCYQALCWLVDSAAELGVDPERVAVMGSSAGGGLAAACALLARDRGGPALCFQALGIPELDDRLDTPSMRAFVDTPLWNRPMAEVSWRYYLGGLAGEPPAYAAPARAVDLAGLPPAYISTMEYDPLRDEGITYAMRLLAAGVPVELHQYPGTFHGASVVQTAAVAQRIDREFLDALRRALHPG